MNICWQCHEKIPDHFQMNSAEMRQPPRPPQPGDISMCGGCGAFSIFTAGLDLVKPTNEEYRRIMNTPELVDMQARLRAR